MPSPTKAQTPVVRSELFRKNGNGGYGVTPNQARRQAGEECLASSDNFRNMVGSAVATTLVACSTPRLPTMAAWRTRADA